MGCSRLHLFTFTVIILEVDGLLTRYCERHEATQVFLIVSPKWFSAVEISHAVETLLIWVPLLEWISPNMQNTSLDSVLPLQMLECIMPLRHNLHMDNICHLHGSLGWLIRSRSVWAAHLRKNLPSCPMFQTTKQWRHDLMLLRPWFPYCWIKDLSKMYHDAYVCCSCAADPQPMEVLLCPPICSVSTHQLSGHHPYQCRIRGTIENASAKVSWQAIWGLRSPLHWFCHRGSAIHAWKS